MTLKQYLENYSATFSSDLDDLWTSNDVDKNGYLDRQEAKEFIAQIQKIISEDRASLYDST